MEQLTRSRRVHVETDRHEIEGVAQMRDGYRSRTTDFFNDQGEFVALTDVTVRWVGCGREESLPFLAVATRHVVLAWELEDGAAPVTPVQVPPPPGS